ncbi:MFS transporter, partial [Parabacteroides merdae]
MKKGLYALSFGTFGLGIAEFIMMSILPDVAAGFDISLSEAGHLISAYALGVCVGAPLVVVVARSWPLRTILLALVAREIKAGMSTAEIDKLVYDYTVS